MVCHFPRDICLSTDIHVDNYGKNAAVFFNDAIAALNDKLVAAGGIVQVGVLKDVSILYFSHY